MRLWRDKLSEFAREEETKFICLSTLLPSFLPPPPEHCICLLLKDLTDSVHHLNMKDIIEGFVLWRPV